MTKEEFQAGVRVYVLNQDKSKTLGIVMFLWGSGQSQPEIAVKFDNGMIARVTDRVMPLFHLEPFN